MQQITIRSKKREEMIDITREVEGYLSEYAPDSPAENQASQKTTTPAFGRPSFERSGIVVVFVQHTTCAVTVNENADPDVQTDMLALLRRLIPQNPMEETHPEGQPPRPSATPPLKGGESKDPSLISNEGGFFKHAEGNSDAHIKSSLMGPSVTIPFENGRLLLGRWQGVYLCEFDGPRERKVVVQVIGG